MTQDASLRSEKTAQQMKQERDELLEALRAIIYASDQCQGHRDCGHSMEPWQQARALLAKIEP